ncbi:DMT family transporter [Salipiger sp. PrR002]|uniref:DMT family transporter n=1 Tax=Salipiger sp. PrR002 TaxID=2706489 RepID=UPI0013BD8278|nr:DMT family transporter [Salipiger sp. PrR002]NDV99316.1 DMT family transporter [Salipiger sp. PrR002]NDW55802.1 DMT family transporter [Salipiger sp. PrR004]
MDTLRAIGMMVLGMALLALSDAFIKLSTLQAPAGQVMIALGLGGCLVFLILARLKRMPLRRADALHPKVLLRNVFEMIGGLGMIVGLSHIPLSVMAAIMQTAPLAVTLGAALFLGETVGWRRWSAIAVGLVGMLMVIRPFGAAFSGWEIFAVVGVIGLAARDLVTRTLPVAIPSVVVSAWGMASIAPVGLVLLLVSGEAPVFAPSALVPILAAVAVTAGGYLAVTTAMRLAEVAAVSPFRYTRLIFTASLGMLIFGERPDGWTYAGAALILCAGLYTFVREHRLARAKERDVNRGL